MPRTRRRCHLRPPGGARSAPAASPEYPSRTPRARVYARTPPAVRCLLRCSVAEVRRERRTHGRRGTVSHDAGILALAVGQAGGPVTCIGAARLRTVPALVHPRLTALGVRSRRVVRALNIL